MRCSIRPGDVVLVVGAGPIGAMHIMLARLSGAGRVIVSDLMPERLAQAAALGADRAINPNEEDLAALLPKRARGKAPMSSSWPPRPTRLKRRLCNRRRLGAASTSSAACLKIGPRSQFDSNLVHYKELRVTATTACSTSDCRRAAGIVNSGRINLAQLITARYPLGHAVKAFAAAADGKSLKVTLQP